VGGAGARKRSDPTAMTPPEPAPLQRSRRLLERGSRLQVAWLLMLVAAAALLVQAIVSGFFLTQAASELPLDGRVLLDLVPDMLWRSVAVSALALVPMAALLAFLAGFRTAGPLVRVEQYLRQVAESGSPGACSEREGDELRELRALVDEALDAVERGGHAEDGSDPAEAA